MMKAKWTFLAVTIAAVAVGPVAAVAEVTIETVPVGNLGNTGEWAGATYGGSGPDRVCGAVAYEYRIGKYEVTAGQYTEFLNAVAATDTYGLYNASMDSTSYSACRITQDGNAGSYTYTADSNYLIRPVTHVNFGDAVRFANWLHNGQPTGPQDLTTTEDGAYFLNGVNDDANLAAVNREADWTWAIASEDAWYKAAYYDSYTSSYFDYATSGDTAPTGEAPPGGVNSASSSIGYLTDVGAYTSSTSPYGTFDQTGGLFEWYEGRDGNFRGLRGGSFNVGATAWTSAPFRNVDCNPTYHSFDFGFRVSALPEVSPIDPGDVNGDGNVDTLDISPFVAALLAVDEDAFLVQYPDGEYWAGDVDGGTATWTRWTSRRSSTS